MSACSPARIDETDILSGIKTCVNTSTRFLVILSAPISVKRY